MFNVRRAVVGWQRNCSLRQLSLAAKWYQKLSSRSWAMAQSSAVIVTQHAHAPFRAVWCMPMTQFCHRNARKFRPRKWRLSNFSESIMRVMRWNYTRSRVSFFVIVSGESRCRCVYVSMEFRFDTRTCCKHDKRRPWVSRCWCEDIQMLLIQIRADKSISSTLK